jgi:hypothetical protein
VAGSGPPGAARPRGDGWLDVEVIDDRRPRICDSVTSLGCPAADRLVDGSTVVDGAQHVGEEVGADGDTDGLV